MPIEKKKKKNTWGPRIIHLTFLAAPEHRTVNLNRSRNKTVCRTIVNELIYRSTASRSNLEMVTVRLAASRSTRLTALAATTSSSEESIRL